MPRWRDRHARAPVAATPYSLTLVPSGIAFATGNPQHQDRAPPHVPAGDSMESMSDLTVRRATADDTPVLAQLIDGFAKGHPAEGHTRSVEMLRDALFGSQPVAHVLLAEKRATAVGFGVWRTAYDLFWSIYGGDGLGLYVVPAQRGLGVALSIIAAICADIREHGGKSRHPTTPYYPLCTNG